MKYELTEAQVFLVEKKLSDLGLAYLPLKEEFLDHVCCLVEEKIANGQNIQQAIHVVFEAIGKDELKELQQQTIFLTNQKSRRMKNVIFVFTTALILLTGSLFFLKKEKDVFAIQAPSPKEFFENNSQMEPICNHHFFEEKTMLHDPPSINPVKGEHHVSSKFGMRFHPVFKKKKFHRGMDFKAPTGTPVLATSNGEIIKVERHKKGYGKHIVIKHDNQYQTLYAHLNEIKVTKGQIVKIGDMIGTVGSTGLSSTPHLHYEVLKNGKAIDPIAYCNP